MSTYDAIIIGSGNGRDKSLAQYMKAVATAPRDAFGLA
jgi:hypothetical protein